jgi:hypothetical protein
MATQTESALLWAKGVYTASAAGSQATTISLGSGQVGHPALMKVFGTTSGTASVEYANSQKVYAACNPNAPAGEAKIPKSAFESATNSITVNIDADAAGTITVLIGFVPVKN